MDQAKAVINLKEGIIELEGPVEFVRYYLDKYAPSGKGPSVHESEAGGPVKQVAVQDKVRGGKRSCTRAVRAEINVGFFDEPRATKAVMDRLTEKGIVCTIGLLRTTLKKAVQEGRLETAGRGRGTTYTREAEAESPVPESSSVA